MRSILPAVAAALISVAAISVPVSAAARDRDDHHSNNHNERNDHREWRGNDHRYYDHGYGPRVIRRTEIIRAAPRVVYREPYEVYERPYYSAQPGVVFSIGLPPIIIPFH